MDNTKVEARNSYLSKPSPLTSFIRGGFGRVSTSSQKGSQSPKIDPNCEEEEEENSKSFEEVTKFEEKKETWTEFSFRSCRRRNSTTQTDESSFPLAKMENNPPQIPLFSYRSRSMECPENELDKRWKRSLQSAMTDPSYYSTGSYHSCFIKPRDTADSVHTPNLAFSHASGSRPPYRTSTPISFVQTPTSRRSASPTRFRGSDGSPVQIPLSDRRTMTINQTSTSPEGRCRSLPPRSSSHIESKPPAKKYSAKSEITRIYSIKTGDVKKMMMADTKSGQRSLDSDDGSRMNFTSMDSYQKTPPTLRSSGTFKNQRGEENVTIIPTSSLLVKSVDDSFRLQDQKINLRERGREQARKDWFENKTNSYSFDRSNSRDSSQNVMKSGSLYSDQEVASAIKTLKSSIAQSPIVKPRTRHTPSRSQKDSESRLDVSLPRETSLPLSRREIHTSLVGEKSIPPSGREIPVPRPRSVASDTSSRNLCKTFDLNEATPQSKYKVVVAIDIGTTYSGYAYGFSHDPDNIQMMRMPDGGDPGVVNQKTPTMLLLTPDESFDSFGFRAREKYNGLSEPDRQKWLFFEKFKMILHQKDTISQSSQISASNQLMISAKKIFSETLRYFKELATKELKDVTGKWISPSDIRWIVTVPAIWSAKAKQFMRESAYEAGLGDENDPLQVLIALEPEVASIYCKKLKKNQIVVGTPRPYNGPSNRSDSSLSRPDFVLDPVDGDRYVVVDCGGGTVDITVHEVHESGRFRELFKPSGGDFGSRNVNEAFRELLEAIFGCDLLLNYERKRPAGFVDLMNAFESRKRGCNPEKIFKYNVALPFSFIDFYKFSRKRDVGTAINKYGDKNIGWDSQGMMTLTASAMQDLFQKTIYGIIEKIRFSLGGVDFRQGILRHSISHLFLVGGFAESTILQNAIREHFQDIINIIIPQGSSVAVLKGAVQYGFDPTIVRERLAQKTYGIGIITPFVHGKDPTAKLQIQDGRNWCMDVFEKFVVADQSIQLGESVKRYYRPIDDNNASIFIEIYSSDYKDKKFITDDGVELCGTLRMELEKIPANDQRYGQPRLIVAEMLFGDTEIKVSVKDMLMDKSVKASINFLNHHGTSYTTKL